MTVHRLVHWLLHRRLRDKVSGAALLLVLIAAVIGALNVHSVYQALSQEKSLKTRQLVEAAHSVAEHFHRRQLAGELDESEARRQALQVLRAMRFNGTDYYWVHHADDPPRMLMHPTVPELEGKLLQEEVFNRATSLQAGDGPVRKTDGRKNLFLAFNEVIRAAGHGHVTYDWPKPLPGGGVSAELYPKLSYVRLYQPWGWVIGSGIYIDDVEHAVWRHVGLNILAWSLLVVAGGVFIYLIHRALTPLTEAAAELDQIASGRLPLHPIKVQQQDEVGRLVDSFNRLHELLAQESLALQQHRSLLLQAQEMARVGHFIFDFGSGTWTSSEMFDALFGLPARYPRDAAGLLACCHPDDRAAVDNWLRLPAQGSLAGPGGGEFRIRRCSDGDERWMHGLLRLEQNDGGAPRLFGVVQDITARKLGEERLRLAASVFANTHEGIIITDACANIVDVNRAFTQITGYPRDEALGRNPCLLSSGRQGREFYANLWHDLGTWGYWSGELWNRRRDGEEYAELLNISAVCDSAGTVTHYVGVFSDITLMKEHQHRLERMAHYDALTGVPNRALLADRMAQALARSRRDGLRMAVCYLDLDGFKPVNDRYGHKAGDALLVEMTRRISDCLRAGDTVARVGGDEFVILLPGLEAADEWEAAVRRVLAAIALPLPMEGQAVFVSASIGVTLFPDDDGDGDLLLRHADQAMYRAKLAGKNRYCVFDGAVPAETVQRDPL